MSDEVRYAAESGGTVEVSCPAKFEGEGHAAHFWQDESGQVWCSGFALSVAEDLRRRYADALATWALMYPISSWALAEGDAAKRLAERWGSVAAKSVMAVRDQELEALRFAVDCATDIVSGVLAVERDPGALWVARKVFDALRPNHSDLMPPDDWAEAPSEEPS